MEQDHDSMSEAILGALSVAIDKGLPSTLKSVGFAFDDGAITVSAQGDDDKPFIAEVSAEELAAALDMDMAEATKAEPAAEEAAA